VLAVALAAGSTAACSRDRSGRAANGPPTTAATGLTSQPASSTPATGPVTDADVTDVDQVIRRVDTELDRLDADLATGEGDTQQVVLEAAKRVATGAITRRVLALQERLTAARSVVRLSDADRSALSSQLQSQVDGLTNLGARIQGDTDDAAVRADAQRIVTDYRVYVLTIPKARGVVVADIELNAADRLSRIADRLAATIDAAEGKDTTTAAADLASLRSKAAAATTAVTPLPAELLALTPSGYPANRAGLEQARQTLRTGRAALADAVILARQVIADLK
jgi:hypothetical protein